MAASENDKTELMKYRNNVTEADSGGFFAISCFFCTHFEELQTVLFEAELIINNKFLTYVYPNTIETCFTPIHLLSGRQLLYYYILLKQHQL